MSFDNLNEDQTGDNCSLWYGKPQSQEPLSAYNYGLQPVFPSVDQRCAIEPTTSSLFPYDLFGRNPLFFHFDDGVRYPPVTNESFIPVRPAPIGITPSPVVLPTIHKNVKSSATWIDTYNAWPTPALDQTTMFAFMCNDMNTNPPSYVPSHLNAQQHGEFGSLNPQHELEQQNLDESDAEQKHFESRKRKADEMDTEKSQAPIEDTLQLTSMLPLAMRNRLEPPIVHIQIRETPSGHDSGRTDDLVESAVELYDKLILKGILPNIEILTQRALLARHTRSNDGFVPMPSEKLLDNECQALADRLVGSMSRREIDLELLPMPSGRSNNLFSVPKQWHRYALGEYLLYTSLGVKPFLADLVTFAGLVDGNPDAMPAHERVDLAEWLTELGCKGFAKRGETLFVEGGGEYTLEEIGLPGMVAINGDA
jgi:hypothetical protein